MKAINNWYYVCLKDWQIVFLGEMLGLVDNVVYLNYVNNIFVLEKINLNRAVLIKMCNSSKP